MRLRIIHAALAGISGLWGQALWSAPSTPVLGPQTSLSQCIALRTTGEDRLLTARWLFAVMAKSPQIADLSAVTAAHTAELDKSFAQLMTRIVSKDCIDQVRPLAAGNVKNAFEKVGEALGETAMGELMGGKEVDKAVGAYTEYLSEDAFRPLMDSLPKQSK